MSIWIQERKKERKLNYIPKFNKIDTIKVFTSMMIILDYTLCVHIALRFLSDFWKRFIEIMKKEKKHK